MEKADHRHRPLLCARRQRPAHRRAAEQRDELATPHSRTSFARAMNTSDKETPSNAAVLLLVRSVFSDEKKLSIAALSHTLPDRLIEQMTPLSAISRWNCSLVYWLPRSE